VILSRKTLKFEIDLDFVLIAITTSLKDYRICHLINKNLNFNFLKSTDLEVDILPGAGPVFFSIYNYHWEASETDFYFIGNKGSDGYLIPEIVAALKIDTKKIKSR
jgi:hypothetical protein